MDRKRSGPEDRASNKATVAELQSKVKGTQTSLARRLSDLTEDLRTEARVSMQRASAAVEASAQQVSDAACGHIRKTSSAIEDTVHGLKSKVDLKRHANEHPIKSVMAATAVGFLIARLLPSGSRRASQEPIRLAVPEPSAVLAAARGMESKALPLAMLIGTFLRPVAIKAVEAYVKGLMQARATRPLA